MHDADVRAAIRAALHKNFANDSSTRIVEEMGIWSGSVRIDVAVINGELHGYELKSALDTLQRLPLQAELYSQVFDRVTLVAAERHYERAIEIVPDWWGIITAAPKRKDGVKLRKLRQPKRNPNLNPLQLSRLLWRSELLEVLERQMIDRGVRSATVETMATRLSESLSLRELSREVRDMLKSRENWLGQPVGDQT